MLSYRALNLSKSKDFLWTQAFWIEMIVGKTELYFSDCSRDIHGNHHYSQRVAVSYRPKLW